MEFKTLIERVKAIKSKYDALNLAKRNAEWNAQQIMAGFVGDVGDLSKIIMAKHNLRQMDNVDEKLAHGLFDCLWSILVLASKYNIDLAAEFMKNMDQLEIQQAMS